MRELSPFDVRMKAAFRRAVEQAGGGVAVASVTRMDASRISRYGNPNDSLMPPADILLSVDKLAAEPICLRAMAEEWNLELVSHDDPKRAHSEIILAVGEFAADSGSLINAANRAWADRHISPNDERVVGAAIAEVEDSIREVKDIIGRRPPLKAVS